MISFNLITVKILFYSGQKLHLIISFLQSEVYAADPYTQPNMESKCRFHSMAKWLASERNLETPQWEK